MKDRDERYLYDMLDEAYRARRIASRHDASELQTNEEFYYSLLHSIMLIGEAASQITAPTREQHPRIPWRDIIGMRNFIIHRYHKRNSAIVWKTATESVPELIAYLEPLFNDDSNDSQPL